jgi:hypothetical protein
MAPAQLGPSCPLGFTAGSEWAKWGAHNGRSDGARRRSRGPHEPLGSGTAAPVAVGRRLWARSLVAIRRCGARRLVVWCCAGTRTRRTKATSSQPRPASVVPQIRTPEKYGSEPRRWHGRVPRSALTWAYAPSHGPHSGILQAGGQGFESHWRHRCPDHRSSDHRDSVTAPRRQCGERAPGWVMKRGVRSSSATAWCPTGWLLRPGPSRSTGLQALHGAIQLEVNGHLPPPL